MEQTLISDSLTREAWHNFQSMNEAILHNGTTVTPNVWSNASSTTPRPFVMTSIGKLQEISINLLGNPLIISSVLLGYCCSIQRSKPKLRLYNLTHQTQPKTVIPMSHKLINTFRGDYCPRQG